ncbi:hypothetical protein Y032_0116g615 [Ancylostoma ceylanicum]|uniref:Uncharacterized protein n=1 Tax=Ancylostoma ceylanicum TaxID=53326 RepID=A0A016TCP0_9BILA|nr:hypothetical protein Y032_0116g615 [Ancylostoma ceylanicum]
MRTNPPRAITPSSARETPSKDSSSCELSSVTDTLRIITRNHPNCDCWIWHAPQRRCRCNRLPQKVLVQLILHQHAIQRK